MSSLQPSRIPGNTVTLFSVSVVWPFSACYVNGIIQLGDLLTLAFFTQHNCLSKLLYVSVVHSFLLVSSISWYGCSTVCFNYAPLEVHFDCFRFLDFTNKSSVNICIHVHGFIWT